MSEDSNDPWVAPNLTGGLGNRLFQFAAAAGAAERWKRPMRFLLSRCGRAEHGPFNSIFRMYPLVRILSSVPVWYDIKEGSRMHTTFLDMGDEPPYEGPVVVCGWRQSPLYFPTDPNVLKADWDWALGGEEKRKALEVSARLDTQKERERTVSLHVRLGDFKILPHHQVNLNHYYSQALQKVGDGQRLHLFSDEPELCSDFFAAICRIHGWDFTVAEVRGDVESLYEMSLCLGGNIVSNSTFSWWGAWFAHQGGSPWATYPSSIGQGMPALVNYVPEWGTTLQV